MWSQVVTNLSHGANKYHSISTLCKLFGFSRQGYYKHRELEDNNNVLISSIVLFCCHFRESENLPKAGCRELFELCKEYLGEHFTLGRDSFFRVLRENDLMLRKARYRPRTTNSNHNYHIYPDLLNTTPKLKVTRNGELIVGDITYIRLKDNEFAYLSILTDAYSRAIVRYCLCDTLKTIGPLEGVNQALIFYGKHKVDINGLIHHSDRGIQYTSNEYTKLLLERNIRISMTQSGDPLHNALAERMNNTLKNSWMFDNSELTLGQARIAID
ncbi:MAG: IS3 family transposase [Bacteroidales bacterium]